MNTDALLTKFAAARGKRAQDESQQAPFGTLQYLTGNDPFSYGDYDPEQGPIVRNTVDVLAPLAGFGVGKYLAQPLAPAAGSAINRGVEASRFFNPTFAKNPITGSRSFFPTYAELLINPNIDQSVGQRATTNIMPSMAPGGSATSKSYQLFERPTPNPQSNTAQSMDVAPVGNRMTRAEAEALIRSRGILGFLEPYMPGLQGNSRNRPLYDPNTPGRISFMGGGTAATNKKPAVPDTELQTVTRQQLLTQRPGLGLINPALIGEGAGPVRYVNPTTTSIAPQGIPAPALTRPPVGITDPGSGIVTPRENPLRRALGNTGNLLQSVNPNSRTSRNLFGLGGALLASELPYYLGLSKDVNPTPFLVDYPVQTSAR